MTLPILGDMVDDDLMARMRARLIAQELLESLTASGQRRVKTQAGADFYGQPIGSIIRRDAVSIANLARSVKMMARHTARRTAAKKKGRLPATETQGPIRAYPNAKRTPDGRVILTEKQLSEFKISTGPHSMTKYVEDATDADGHPVKVLTKEREAIHDAIVTNIIKGVKPRSGTRTTIFHGGGTGAGKSTVTKTMPNYPVVRELHETDSKPPGEAVLIDPDGVKKRLPEWGQPDMDTTAAFTHEESSLIAAQARDLAITRNLDIVVDGTGNGKPTKMTGKVHDAKAAGYSTQGLYVTVPASEAIVRGVERGISDGRIVPEAKLLEIHKAVTVTALAMHDQYDRFDLFDTDVPWKAAPIPIVVNGKIVDQARWDLFVGKTSITDLEACQDALRRAEAKVYHDVEVKETGEIVPAAEVKNRTIERIQALIARYSSESPSA